MGAVRRVQPADGSIGLIIGATIILRLSHKRSYMLTCLVPLAYLYVTVNYAGYWMVKNVYLNPAAKGYNLFNAGISIVMLALGLAILVSAVRRWKALLGRPAPQAALEPAAAKA